MGTPQARSEVEALSLRKERGAFFTPTAIAQFLTNWALRCGTDAVLEPSCGEASFLLAAATRLRQLDARIGGTASQLHGFEIHRPSLAAARKLLSAQGCRANLRRCDFFDADPKPAFDAVIGNPPYVRYQNFSGDARAKALRAAFTLGVRLNGLASSWAAFVVHSARFLKPEGRLGLVLPAELLSVKYAAPVRSFLLRRFKSIRLVTFEELVFPGVTEEVVLLLAEGTGGAPCFELYQARDLGDLERLDTRKWTWFAPEADDKWTPALLPADALALYRDLCQSGHIESLLDWGETYLGAVTGNNRYFALAESDVARFGLAQRDLVRVSPPGSRHLSQLTFSNRAWRQVAAGGATARLFYPTGSRLSDAARRYVDHGCRLKVDAAYKCSVREPWWRVPLVPTPDILLGYMGYDRPKLVANLARVRHLNSVYGVKLKAGRRRIGMDLLPMACLNSLTLLGAEIVGRAYGGGLLKLEPTEADRLPVPSIRTLESSAFHLRESRGAIASALARGDVAAATRVVDEILLRRHLRLSASALAVLRRAREVLFSRRRARSGSPRS